MTIDEKGLTRSEIQKITGSLRMLNGPGDCDLADKLERLFSLRVMEGGEMKLTKAKSKLTHLQRDALVALQKLASQNPERDGFYTSELGPDLGRVCRTTLTKNGLVTRERSNQSGSYYHFKYSITDTGRSALTRTAEGGDE
ncbi:MAG TPA: hypothetical protein VN155_16790 [Devosia sp.]|nr:hypothetical protein [Devosia sp.]